MSQATDKPGSAFIRNLRVSTDKTLIMSIINASPESFYHGSVASDHQAVRDAAEKSAEDGADILDIGAMSTAPYKETHVEAEVEAERMQKAVEAARGASGLPITADTQRASVARVAIAAGADGINDVSGLSWDPEMADLIAEKMCAAVLMANESSLSTDFSGSAAELVAHILSRTVERARAAGISNERIILDPGIGFFRKQRISWLDFDLEILRHLERFQSFGRPLLVSASRKSFLGKLSVGAKAEERLPGSLAAALWSAAKGAAIIRTHDPRATRSALALWQALQSDN